MHQSHTVVCSRTLISLEFRMQRFAFVAFLAALAVAVSGQDKRCSRYNLPNNWDPAFLGNSEWIVVASTNTGSALSWYTNYERCDAYFTVGAECCGGCSYITFNRISKYTDYYAYTMTQWSLNYCTNNYDVVENFFGQAYPGLNTVYRSYTREMFGDSKYFAYSDPIDPNFITYDPYAKDLSYSVGVLDYCKSNKIVVLAVCNNFQYLNWANYPTVIVLAQKPRLCRAEKDWVLSVLDKNKISPYGLTFRPNYECPARSSYAPQYYIN